MEAQSAKNELLQGGRSSDKLICDKIVQRTRWEHPDAKDAGRNITIENFK